MDIFENDSRYVAGTYARFGLCIDSGSGAVCRGSNGRDYLDFTSGIGVNSLGFCPPGWVEAVSRQAATLTHTSNLYYTRPCVQLAQTLCQRSGMQSVFFANSGAEANEGAIKAARKYSHDHYGPERSQIVTLQNSFHGRTVTTLAATGQDSFHTHFHPFTPGFAYGVANDIASLTEAATPDTCAILLELVQGEGGVVPLTPDFVAGVAQLCAQRDILLIIDEVQTGIGRTGSFFAYQQYGLQPDIVTAAKGLGGGLPIGAVLFGQKTHGVLEAGTHGSTFGGNPICCAGANYLLEQLTPAFLAEVQRKGSVLRTRLAAIPGIGAVSGMGLMLGATVAPRAARAVAQQCLEQGLLVLTAKDRLRLLPPLNITDHQLDQGLAILAAVLQNGGERQ